MTFFLFFLLILSFLSLFRHNFWFLTVILKYINPKQNNYSDYELTNDSLILKDFNRSIVVPFLQIKKIRGINNNWFHFLSNKALFIIVIETELGKYNVYPNFINAYTFTPQMKKEDLDYILENNKHIISEFPEARYRDSTDEEIFFNFAKGVKILIVLLVIVSCLIGYIIFNWYK